MPPTHRGHPLFGEAHRRPLRVLARPVPSPIGRRRVHSWDRAPGLAKNSGQPLPVVPPSLLPSRVPTKSSDDRSPWEEDSLPKPPIDLLRLGLAPKSIPAKRE